MRKLFLTVLLSASCALAFSQTKKEKVTPAGVISSVTASEPGQGKVTLSQDPKMQTLLKKQFEEKEDDLYIYYSGYRVQVFMSNAQRKAKEAAYEREKLMREKLPDLTYYVDFTSPFWKLRVGDCRTYTEALVLANKVREEFPDFASDVSVVKEEQARDSEFEKLEEKK